MENFTLLLKKYADFIVRVGVNPQPGQTLIINCCLEAAPLARLCVRSAYEAGARDVLVNWSDNDVSRSRMELGSEEALTDNKPYQLRRYLDYAESEGGVCVLHLLADDPEVYAGLDGAKISRVNAAQRKFMAPWREYTMNDRVQWSIAAMPSAPWAKKIFPELDEAAAIEKLWQLIFDVCRVTDGDPVNEWKAHLDRLTGLKDKMNALDLESVHFESGNGTDLTVGIADKAVWESAASVSEKGVVFLPNIPTEEVFTAPHKDKVNGIVYGTKPYVFNGQLIKGFHVTFKDGRVVEHGADEGAELLGQLLDTDEGARSIGEVALVPASSPINRSGALFYSTLFDENAACHIAFGASYPGTTKGGTALSKEDLKKTELYHQNAERAKAQAAFADYGQYLDSLEMTATIKGFEPLYIQRIAQLTNKSNQFNLTTLRCSEDDIRAMAGDKNDLCLCGKLVDKFGDNGIVTVVAGRQQGDVLDLTLWLMSCRVLKRGMEDAMMDTVVAEAAARGVKTIVGHYYPTAKNAMVREFYAQYDFAKTAEDADGNTEWTLDVAAYTPKHPHMKIER